MHVGSIQGSSLGIPESKAITLTKVKTEKAAQGCEEERSLLRKHPDMCMSVNALYFSIQKIICMGLY